jgi:hypothetical protein
MFQNKITSFIITKNKCYVCKNYNKKINIMCDSCRKKKEDDFIKRYKEIVDEDLRKIYLEDFY